MPTPCSDIDKLIPTYLDGELAESELHSFEHHLAECEGCATEVSEEQLFLERVRTALATPPAPDTLVARLARALDAEDQANAKVARRARFAWVLPGAATLTAAAALLVFILDVAQPATNANNANAPASDDAEIALAPPTRGMINAAPVRTGDVARRAREYVGVPVRAPRFADAEASLRGWEPLTTRNQRSALLLYKVKYKSDTYRVEVQTLDARNLDTSNAERRVVRGTEVWVATHFGVNGVSYTDENGVGYVFSSQMDMDALVDLVVRSALTR